MTEPQRTAPPPPRDMFGGRPIGGLGIPAQKAKNFKGTLARLLGYLRPHRARLGDRGPGRRHRHRLRRARPKILGLATTKIFEAFFARRRRARRRD